MWWLLVALVELESSGWADWPGGGGGRERCFPFLQPFPGCSGPSLCAGGGSLGGWATRQAGVIAAGEADGGQHPLFSLAEAASCRLTRKSCGRPGFRLCRPASPLPTGRRGRSPRQVLWLPGEGPGRGRGAELSQRAAGQLRGLSLATENGEGGGTWVVCSW